MRVRAFCFLISFVLVIEVAKVLRFQRLPFLHLRVGSVVFGTERPSRDTNLTPELRSDPLLKKGEGGSLLPGEVCCTSNAFLPFCR